MRCANCNAPVQDDAETCTFCNTVTEHGKAQRQRRAARADDEVRAQAQAKAEAQKRAEREAMAERGRQIQQHNAAASRAMLASTLGLLACCLPFGPIAGIVLAQHARGQARRLAVPPGRGVFALAVAVGCLLLSLSLWGLVAAMQMNESARKRELSAIISKEAGAPTLTSAAACALLELELITSKYEKYDNFNDELSCPGELAPHGDAEAMLLGSHFTHSGTRVDVVACFHRSGAWTVKQLRADDRCDEVLEHTAPAPDAKKTRR